MQLKSLFSIQGKNLRDLDKAKDYLNLVDLKKEQGFLTDLADYWDKVCDLNPSDPRFIEYED